MRSLLTMSLFCGALMFSAGCTVLGTVQGMAAATVEAFRPTSFDGFDPGSESSDPWVQQVGATARGHRPVEREPDPLGLKKYFMSEKARDIERNMGIE